MGCMGCLPSRPAGASFFFCSWLVMIFWGIVAPLMAAVAKRERGWKAWFKS